MAKAVMHRNALPTGSRLNGYIIERVLGEPGGFGIVYLAKNVNIGKLVAIKEYFPSDLAMREGHVVSPKSPSHEDDFEWGLTRFLDEAKTLVYFNHPNIIQVLDYFTANSTAYMLMPYEEGQPLNELIKDNALTEEELLQHILLPLLNGLSHVHAAGFMHRDIKPGNIFMRRSDEMPVLLDFGSARNALGNKSKSLTSLVTPGYAPFEQYHSDGNQGAWTDIYALGAVAYRIVTGNRPPIATSRAKSDKMIPAIEAGKGQFSESLLRAIDHALAVNEEDRPQSCDAWRQELTTFSANSVDITYPPEDPIVPPEPEVVYGFWETIIKKIQNIFVNFQNLFSNPSKATIKTWHLSVDIDGGAKIKTLELNKMSDSKGFVVGRDANISHCPLKDSSVSGRHCRLMLDQDILYIEDLNSTNGTMVNGEEIAPFQAVQVESGDQILIGELNAILVKIS